MIDDIFRFFTDIFHHDDRNNQEPMKMDTRYIPDSLRQEVFERDGRRCVRCGSRSNLELDHNIPRSQGGATSARNLQVLCRECNRKKGRR